MYDLRIFNNEEYGQVSVIIENNKEYFEATKIAKILGYKNPNNAINTHCKKQVKLLSFNSCAVNNYLSVITWIWKHQQICF